MVFELDDRISWRILEKMNALSDLLWVAMRMGNKAFKSLFLISQIPIE